MDRDAAVAHIGIYVLVSMKWVSTRTRTRKMALIIYFEVVVVSVGPCFVYCILYVCRLAAALSRVSATDLASGIYGGG